MCSEVADDAEIARKWWTTALTTAQYVGVGIAWVVSTWRAINLITGDTFWKPATGWNRLNDVKVSDSDCWHHDQNCTAPVVVVYTLRCSTTASCIIIQWQKCTYICQKSTLVDWQVDHVYSSLSVDWQRLSRLSQSTVCKVHRSHTQRLTPETKFTVWWVHYILHMWCHFQL